MKMSIRVVAKATGPVGDASKSNMETLKLRSEDKTAQRLSIPLSNREHQKATNRDSDVLP